MNRPPRLSPRDRLAAVRGWTKIERTCTACGTRTPAACVDGTGTCPKCARNETPDTEKEGSTP